VFSEKLNKGSVLLNNIDWNKKGASIMSRGKSFNHKKKGHPGNFPEHTLVERHSKDAIGDEEFLNVREAFKNRVETEEIE
jgi:hypothetical protein